MGYPCLRPVPFARLPVKQQPSKEHCTQKWRGEADHSDRLSLHFPTRSKYLSPRRRQCKAWRPLDSAKWPIPYADQRYHLSSDLAKAADACSIAPGARQHPFRLNRECMDHLSNIVAVKNRQCTMLCQQYNNQRQLPVFFRSSQSMLAPQGSMTCGLINLGNRGLK